MPGLGDSHGRGGATTNQMDVRFADSVLIMGSNMAECHPVSFRFVTQAKLNGAKVIHADPRFTRTSAMADVYAPLRAGADIVFLGGLIRYVLEEHRYFQKYVSAYTNAATLITEEFQDTEDLEGLFSGFDAERKEYDPKSWRYDAEPAGRPGNQPVRDLNDASTFSARGGRCRFLVREPGRSGILVNPGRGSEFSESSEPSRGGEPGVFRRRASGASRRPAPGTRNNAGQAAWPWPSGK